MGDDPTDRDDPTGLCETDKSGNITGCNIKIDSGDLKGKEKEKFEADANAPLKHVAKVGEAVQDKGNDSQKAAWGSVKTLVVDQKSVTNSKGQQVAGNFDGKSDTVSYNRAASKPVGDRTTFQAIQSVYILHEIFHAEKDNRELASFMFAVHDAFQKNKFRQVLEGATEAEAESAASTWGLAKDLQFHSPYLKN